MDLMSSLSAGLNQSLFPGHRLPRSNGWQEAEKYPMPVNCEAVILDADPKSDHIYMKVSDTNGGERFQRYRLVEDPVPRFEPENYVTKSDFTNFKEDILNAINSLRQPVTADRSAGNRPNGGSKQSGRSNNEFGKSESDVQSDGKQY